MVRTPSRRVSIVAGALGLALALTGCGSGSSGGSPSGAAGPGGTAGAGSLKGKTVALVGYGSSNPWGAVFNKYFDQHLASTGVKIQDLTTMDTGTQVQNFSQAVAEKPSLIVLAILDTKAMVPSIEKAKQAGVPVLVFDGPTDPSVANDVMSVLSNSEQLGEFAAQNIIDGLKAQGRQSGNIIVLTGTKSMLVTQDRMQGFNKVMGSAPQYKVIAEEDANWDPTLSGKDATQLIAKYGCSGIQAAYGMADYMALPIVQAAKQARCAVGGKNGMVVTSSNCFKAGIQAVESGQLYGTATEDPVTIAIKTAKYVELYLTGQNPPKNEVVQEHRITAANVHQFAAPCSHA